MGVLRPDVPLKPTPSSIMTTFLDSTFAPLRNALRGRGPLVYGALVTLLLLLSVFGGRSKETLAASSGGAPSSEAVRREAERDTVRRTATARIEALQGELGVVRRTLVSTDAEKKAAAARFEAYCLNHKMATAAVLAGVTGIAVNVDDSKEISDSAKQAAGAVAVAAGVYFLFNAEECLAVADQMMQAAAAQKGFDARLAALRKQAADLESALRAENRRLAQARAD